MRYEAAWAHDREGERATSSASSTGSSRGGARYPDLHVYHYASYEPTALNRLMGEHGTREDEVDDLLRGEVLVDLYRVVKQALRASVARYSIKEIEELYGFERTAEVSGGDESIVLFEQWLETGDDALLDEIEALQRGGLPLDRRAPRLAARDSARPSLPWRPPPEPRAVPRDERGCAPKRARAPGRAARAVGRGGRRALAHRAAPRLPPPRGEAGLVGVLPHVSAARRGGADRGHGQRSAGSSWSASRSPTRARSSTRFASPQQEHKIGGDAVDPATREDLRRDGRRRAGTS